MEQYSWNQNATSIYDHPYHQPEQQQCHTTTDINSPFPISPPLTAPSLSWNRDVQFRFLVPGDLEEVRTLCQDWFPVDYPLSWYKDITSSTRFYALAAVYKLTIIGLIVAEIKSFLRLNKEDRDILPEYGMGRDIEVGYILSLGVDKRHRRNRVATLLLEQFLNHLTTPEGFHVKAVFLHVLTTNRAAISFYQKQGFKKHSILPYYYIIRGQCEDGYAYVRYINGGHPPWTLLDHLKNWCSNIRTGGGLCSWIGHRIRGVIRWMCHRTISLFNLFIQH